MVARVAAVGCVPHKFCSYGTQHIVSPRTGIATIAGGLVGWFGNAYLLLQ